MTATVGELREALKDCPDGMTVQWLAEDLERYGNISVTEVAIQKNSRVQIVLTLPLPIEAFEYLGGIEVQE